MKALSKKALSVLLVLIMCVSLSSMAAVAEDADDGLTGESAEVMEAADSAEFTETGHDSGSAEGAEMAGTAVDMLSVETGEGSGVGETGEPILLTYINPLYEGIITEQDLLLPTDVPVTYADGDPEYVPVEEAAKVARAAMVDREESVTVYVSSSTAVDAYDLLNTIVDTACQHTGVPNEGDYIQTNLGGSGARIYYYVIGGLYCYTVTLTFTFYTDAEQEAAVTARLDELMPSIISEDMTDYEKICAIYHYITYNVTYDYDNLNDSSYKLKYTAYAALINGTSVCQGYGSLLYRMMLEAGIDCRYISGTGNGGNHGWNIVRLDGLYYNVDSTWDATYYTTLGRYRYFMQCNANFDDHARDSKYNTDEFNAAYPMAASDYGASVIYHDMKLTSTTATCGEPGTDLYTCVICGYQESKDVPATGDHAWNDPVFTWADDHNSASAERTCAVCGTSESVEATVINSRVPATCTEDGETVHKATAVFDGTEYEDVYEEYNIPALGHDWGDVTFDWSAFDFQEGTGTITASRTCQRDGCDATETETAAESHVSTKDPTCTEPGEITYTATATFDGIAYSEEQTGQTEPLGHDWGDAAFNWDAFDLSEGTGSVTASRFCQRSGCGQSETETATVEGIVTKEPSCVDPGTMTYTATVVFDDQSYSENKETEIPATGHTWGDTVWTWDEYTATSAVRTCQKCGVPDEAQVTMTTPDLFPATCTDTGLVLHNATATFSDGTREYTCKEEVIPALGHSWDTPTWNWAADNNSAEAIFTCSVCKTTQSVSAAVSSETTSPDCTEPGEITYTAVVEFDGNTYSDSKTVETELPLGHTWGAAEWIWDGYTAVSATRTCEICGTTDDAVEIQMLDDYVAPTCTEEGRDVYYATAVFSDDEKAYDSRTEVIPATGHTWSSITWTWEEDGSSATASRECTVCGEKQSLTDSNPSIQSRVEPTCTVDGSITYLASVNFDSYPVANQYTVTVPATGHTWGAAEWTWDGYTAVSATRTCETCGTTDDAVEIQMLDDYVAPTCTEDGRDVYYATAVFSDNEKAYDSRTEVIPATGHSWSSITWTWAEDGSSATASRECTVCGEKQSLTDSSPSIQSQVEPTCTVDGSITYLASVNFDSSPVANQYTVTVPATGHTWGDVQWVWNGYTAVSASRTCQACGVTDETENIQMLDDYYPPSCTEDGSDVYHATAIFSDGDTASDSRTEVIPATGHTWSVITWNWASDLSSVTASRECTVCGYVDTRTSATSVESAVAPTCTENGEIVYVATFIFDSDPVEARAILTIPATGHNWGDVQWTWDGYTAVSATRTCETCGTTDDAVEIQMLDEHVAPTCTEDGRDVYYATAVFSDDEKAYDSKTEVIPALGHTPVTDPAVEPTCTDTGLTEGSHCSVCNAVLTAQEVVPALGHSWDSGKVTKEASCTEDGEMTYTCERCSETRTEVIPAAGHTPVTDPAVEPTCTDTGLTEGSHCSVCNEVLVPQEVVPALGHSWVESDEVISRDEDEIDIDVQFICENCGMTVDRILVRETIHDGVTAHADFEWSDLIDLQTMIDMLEDENLTIDFAVTVQDSNAGVSSEDESLVEDLIQDLWAGQDYSVFYLEIEVSMSTYDEDGNLVTALTFEETINPIAITVAIPDELLDAGADEYAVIRIHDGQAERIDATDNGDGTLTFSSDQFSTYAIVSLTDTSGTDEPNTEEPGNTGGTTGNTGGTEGTTGGTTSDTGTTESGTDGSETEEPDESNSDSTGSTDTGTGSGSSTGSTYSGSNGSSGSGSSGSSGTNGSGSSYSGTSPQTDGPDAPAVWFLWIAVAVFAVAGCVMLIAYKVNYGYRGEKEKK